MNQREIRRRLVKISHLDEDTDSEVIFQMVNNLIEDMDG
jgi:hypothetical protein